MPDIKSDSDAEAGGSTKHDWLTALVTFLLAWGSCIGAALLMLAINGKYGQLPEWVGSDVKATARYNTKGEWHAETDIFAERNFSYFIEEKQTSAEPKQVDDSTPSVTPDAHMHELPFIQVCGPDKGKFKDTHRAGNLYHVEIDEPIVRKGDLLYTGNGDKNRTFTAKLYKLLAYQEYLSLREPVKQGMMHLINVSILSIFVLIFFGYAIYFLREDFYDAMHKQWLFLLLILIHLVLLTASHLIYRMFDGWPVFFMIMMFPAALGPCLMSNMLGRRTGICGAICLSILTPVIVGGAYQFYYFIFSLISSLAAVISFQKVHNRIRFLLGGIFLAFTCFAMAVLFSWYHNLAWVFEAPLTLFWIKMPGLILISSLVVILGMLLMPPVCELIFDVTTVFTLNELNNRDHPLLERLLKQAPGTYEHSLTVARLSSDAARAIGANVRLVETCAYFHDIGKLCAPKMFAENLLEDEENPHDSISSEESAEILRKHVKYGIEMAKKYRLPHEVREAIAQHHGTSVMAFFADEARRKAEEEGRPVPSPAAYSYSGPLPRRPEVVIVSIADVCEAAIRASARKWPKVTSSLIREKVVALVHHKFDTGQFAEAAISLSSLHIMIDAMVESLCVTYHVRPEYPDNPPPDDTDNAGENAENKEDK